MNISALGMQHPLKQTPDIMKVTHHPTPPSMPAAAAAAAAMHAGAQHQHSAQVQVQERTSSHLDASSPLTVSPSSSRSPSPAGTLSACVLLHLPGLTLASALCCWQADRQLIDWQQSTSSNPACSTCSHFAFLTRH